MPRSLITTPRIVVRDFGKCLSFPGVGNNEVTVANATGFQTQAFTYVMWINPSNVAGGGALITGNNTNGADLIILSGGQLRISKLGSGGFGSSTSNVLGNTWQHVAFTYDSLGNYAFYINGIQSGTGTSAQAFAVVSGLMIGQESGFTPSVYQGLMDEIMFFNTALSASQISDIYYKATISSNILPNLQMYLKCNEGTGTSASDASGNGNTGTLNGSSGMGWSSSVAMVPRSLASRPPLPESLLNGIVSYYKFDENTGTNVGDSAGTDSGTWGGTLGSQWTPGIIGSGGSFNGTDNTVVLTTNPTIVTDNFSIMAWIKPNGIPQGSSAIFHNGNDNSGWGLYIGDGTGSSGNKLVGLNPNIAWVSSGAILTNNVWQHVGLIRRSGTWYFYINGVEINSGYNANPGIPASGRASIGFEYNTTNVASRFIAGAIDEVGVWTVALTGTQVTQLYNNSFGLQYRFSLNRSLA